MLHLRSNRGRKNSISLSYVIDRRPAQSGLRRPTHHAQPEEFLRTQRVRPYSGHSAQELPACRRLLLFPSPDRAVRPVLKDNAKLLQLIARRIGSLPVLPGPCLIALLHESLDLGVAALFA